MKRRLYIRALSVVVLTAALGVGIFAFQNPKILSVSPASETDPSTVFITGIVRESGKGLLLSGVKVTVSGQLATTNAIGKFTIPLTRGEHDLLLSKEGYQDQKRHVNLRDGTNQQIIIDLVRK